MPRLCWVTDIHLDFLRDDEVDAFIARIAAALPDAVLVGGDVGHARSVEGYLRRIADGVAAPVHFVLGNHDFYHGSIGAVRARMAELSRARLGWLPERGVVALSPRTGLVGHDGWSDGRAGDWERSTVMLNDYLLIQDLLATDRAELRRRLGALGDDAACHLSRVLPAALERFEHVVVLTHVPPFRESCWHAGRISDDNWLPHFTCVAVGEVLREAMAARPDRRMTVLCGHTHGAGVTEVLPNLVVRTGGAAYGRPELQAPIVVD